MELFKQAVTVMVLGMGLVFVFLAVVILCVQAAARMVQGHESRRPAGSDGGDEIAAAVAVAIRERGGVAARRG